MLYMLWPSPLFWPHNQTYFLALLSWTIYSTSLGHSFFNYKNGENNTYQPRGECVPKLSTCVGGMSKEEHWEWR